MLQSDNAYESHTNPFNSLTVSFCLVTLAADAQPNLATTNPSDRSRITFEGTACVGQFFVKDLISRGAVPILDQINYSQANMPIINVS